MSVRDDRRLNMSLDEIINGKSQVVNGKAERASSDPPDSMASNSPLLRNLYPRPAMTGPQRQNNDKNYQRGGFQKAKRSFFEGSRNQLNGGKSTFSNGQRQHQPYYAPRWSPWVSGSTYSGGGERRRGGGGRSRTPGPSLPSPWEGGVSVWSSEGGGGSRSKTSVPFSGGGPSRPSPWEGVVSVCSSEAGGGSRSITPVPGSGGGPFSSWRTTSADSGGRRSRSRTPGPYNRPRFSRARSCGPIGRSESRRPEAVPSDLRGSYLSLLSAGSSSNFLQPTSLFHAEESYTPSPYGSRGREFPGRSYGDHHPSIQLDLNVESAAKNTLKSASDDGNHSE